MKKLIQHFVSLKHLVICLVLGGMFLGIIWYVDQRFSILDAELQALNNSLKQTESGLNDKIIAIGDEIVGTTSDLSNLLEAEKQKNSSLHSEFENITKQVSTLTKLTTTDEELLKKYSKVYFLNEHYVPLSLSSIDEKYRGPTSANYQISSNVWPYLSALLVSAEGAGLELLVQSAYRSFGAQSMLKANNVMIYGEGTANRFSADQGYSEHQLGTTIDFTTVPLSGSLIGFDKTPEYTWLLENAHRFGFILSYPAGNSYYKYEPWHWRFVGIALATRLYNEGKYFYDMDQRVIDTYLANIFD